MDFCTDCSVGKFLSRLHKRINVVLLTVVFLFKSLGISAPVRGIKACGGHCSEAKMNKEHPLLLCSLL